MLLRVEVASFHPAMPKHDGLVSVALFLASRRTVVSRHPTLWSPDFPLSARLSTDSDCLANSRRDFNTRGHAASLSIVFIGFALRNFKT